MGTYLSLSRSYRLNFSYQLQIMLILAKSYLIYQLELVTDKPKVVNFLAWRSLKTLEIYQFFALTIMPPLVT